MNLKGERIIPASVERTWAALNDPQTLKACINGCESIEATGENQYLALMAVRIGPVNAKFKGRLQLSDIVPLASYKINFDGQGGVAGFGKGSAAVTLSPSGTDGQATVLNYVADAQVGGKIAQIGSRLVESAAAKIADDFFKAFEAKMTTAAAPDSSPGSGSAGPAGATPGSDLPPASGSGPVPGTGSGFASSAAASGAPYDATYTAAGGDAGLSSPVMATSASSEPASVSAGTASAAAGMASAASATSDASAASSSFAGTAGTAGFSGTAGTADATPMRSAPTPDPVQGGDPQPKAAAGGSSTVWWIAGIIILALLAYFFTR